jgi:hypothetical protein
LTGRAAALAAAALLALTAPAAAQDASSSERPAASPRPDAPTPPAGEAPDPSTLRATDGAALGDPREAEAPPPPPAAPRRRGLPVPFAERPLTLTEGTLRFDHAVLLRTGGGLIGMMAFQLGLGITDDLELALLWPIARDPTLTGTYRVYTDGTLDVGVRAAVQVPLVTEGNTDARVALPIVLRGGPVRFFAAAELGMLFTANVSTLLAIPAQLAVSVGRAFAFGAQGWIGLLDGRHAAGDVGGFLCFTAWAAGRPVVDVRISAAYAPAEGDLLIHHSITLLPQLW